ncbi:superoxide dismutase family protein [Inhella sp.]|uniref:superoxide dismutase family protein n=1 Tax=Inhella sp. TaxID=1921806 RepID=UPI0035B17EAD
MNLHQKLGWAALILGLQACASQDKPDAHAAHGSEAAQPAKHDMAMHKEGMGHKMHDMGGMAMASLSPAAAGGATGLVMFHTKGEDLMVHVKASGFAPGTAHGFHVHANGNCASPDFSSAGGHFNPGAHPHGPQDAARHAGDMPNLQADAQGKVDQKFVLKGAKLQGETGLVGRAVIVHADPDDFKTQPTGNSGARMACGVIAAH